MNRLHHAGPLTGGLVHLTRAFSSVIVACALMTMGTNGAEKNMSTIKTDEPDWKPILGDWYDYKDATGQRWDARDIATFKGKVATTFLLRRADEETTEHWRAVLFADGKKIMPLPYNVGGKLRIAVYWYDALGDEGPFLRLADHWGEYVIDLRRKTTAETRRTKGRFFAGELQPGEDKTSTMSVDDSGDKLRVTASGKPARELTDLLTREREKKVGEIRSDGR